MKFLLFFTLIFFGMNSHLLAKDSPIAIAIHGGAGTILKKNLTPEIEAQYHAKLEESLRAGYQILESGGSSIDAIQATIIVLENSPLFNAGKGAVFTHHKTNELDASIMEGKTLNAGAISGVTRVKNPILLAAKVMTESKHVMLSGEGAETFAKQQQLEFVAPEYFHTPRRLKQIDNLLTKEKNARIEAPTNPNFKYGTVGAVALDKHGNLAAGTSTGGMTNKKFGRIGDSPIIGAGTYADNKACAISATGHGEYFIRAAVAHDICARVLYQGVSLQAAADAVIFDKLKNMGGDGGIVGMSPQGDPVFSFNTPGMYRGYIDKSGSVFTGIYGPK
ncbi:isoaspartyl peptidase/L-asparaginase [Aliikangiella marina]|uniref:Isoaspartyl peptidase n=1 Tax=Aliikangiella marina TaxID=1712262 RepID=A0A545TDK2_9GAMM|nr:isoaspartyl peptidase/L-asparaginase [Aliikangiella marina]TQV75246.1 isoaspartyl peptidase/L-asparaginase [Aliikangiella marina]